jgi:heptosyltransferase-2
MRESNTAGSTGAEHFLIVGPAWVGDMVMAQSLFMSLKLRYPDCKITVIAPAWTLPLLARMSEVDSSLSIPIGHGEFRLGARRALGKVLRMNGYTRAIVLPNSFKSALLPYFAGIPVRIGWRGEWRNLLLTDCRKLDAKAMPLMVQRFAALAYDRADSLPERLPKPKLELDPAAVATSLEQFALTCTRPILALCPGAEYGPSKQWPAEHFAALSTAVIDIGWDVWIFGSGNDKGIADEIVSGVNFDKLAHCKNLAALTSLAEAIDLMSATTAVVSNDSGLMHVAAALNKPLVALFGSTSPDFTPPLTQCVRILSTDIDCRPCFKRVCPYGHLRCLTELAPVRVVSALDELMTVQTN